MIQASSTLINRQHSTASRSQQQLPVIVSCEETPVSKARRTGRGGRRYLRPLVCNCFGRKILLPVVPLFLCACFLLVGLLVGLEAIEPVGLLDAPFVSLRALISSPSPPSSRYNVANFPDDWETYTYRDIRDHFHCGARSRDNTKPLPTLEDWQFMRDKFTEVVDPQEKWDDPVPPTLGYSLVKGIPVPPPYYAKLSPGKGRGLFASRYIEKGELVHDGTKSDVIFPDAMAWRRFIFSLPRDLACDCTDWHWMQRLKEGGKQYMLGAINISSLMNSAGEEFGTSEVGGPNAIPESSISGRFYATRDIEEGEEILTDYEVFETKYKNIGL